MKKLQASQSCAINDGTPFRCNEPLVTRDVNTMAHLVATPPSKRRFNLKAEDSSEESIDGVLKIECGLEEEHHPVHVVDLTPTTTQGPMLTT